MAVHDFPSGVTLDGDPGNAAGPLDGSGLLPTSQLPPLAIGEIHVVANEAAMLALTAQRGDVAKRTDTGISYWLSTDDPTQVANWVSVAALTIAGVTGLQAALDAKAPLASPTFTGTIELGGSAAAPAGTVRAIHADGSVGRMAYNVPSGHLHAFTCNGSPIVEIGDTGFYAGLAVNAPLANFWGGSTITGALSDLAGQSIGWKLNLGYGYGIGVAGGTIYTAPPGGFFSIGNGPAANNAVVETSTPDSNAVFSVEAATGELYLTEAALTKLGSDLGAGAVTGSIALWGTGSAPTGYLICDGSAVSRTTYATLFALIGTTFGTGNGSTTFNLPDFRGRAPIGAGTGSGLTARTLAGTVGAETHTLTGAESGLPAHSHTTANKGAGTGPGNQPYPAHYSTDNGWAGSSTSTEGPTSASNAHNNMQPSLVVHFIIKT